MNRITLNIFTESLHENLSGSRLQQQALKSITLQQVKQNDEAGIIIQNTDK